MLEGELAAPRRAEEVDPLELELVAQRRELVEEDLDAPVDVLRSVRAAAADLVVEHDGAAALGQPLEGREVVVRRAGPAVQGDERIAALDALPDDAVPRSVAAKVDVSLAGLHA